MKFIKQDIDGLFIVEPNLFTDERGVFRRSFCEEEFNKAGIVFNVSQGNISENKNKYTLRGFHYQKSPSNESKIMTCVSGSIHNIVLDLRKDSRTYLKWVSLRIDAKNRKSIVVPAGCANAFLTLSDNTIVNYFMGDAFRQDSYRGIRFNDPHFEFDWPHQPLFISDKDKSFPNFSDEK